METHFRKIEEINNRKTISHANTFYFGPFPLGLFLLTPPPPTHTLVSEVANSQAWGGQVVMRESGKEAGNGAHGTLGRWWGPRLPQAPPLQDSVSLVVLYLFDPKPGA